MTCKFTIFGKQGGNDSFGVHCPTKTAPSECDIKRGRSLDVPASDMATRPSRKPGKPRVKSHMSVEFPYISCQTYNALRLMDWGIEAKAVGYITFRHFSVCVGSQHRGPETGGARARERARGSGSPTPSLVRGQILGLSFSPAPREATNRGRLRARRGGKCRRSWLCGRRERERERESASASLFACRAMKIAVSFLLRSAGGGRIAPTPSTLAKQRGRSKEEGKKPCSLREMWTETPLLSLQEAKRVQALDPAL